MAPLLRDARDPSCMMQPTMLCPLGLAAAQALGKAE